mgnify:CR=1 FL=1
MTSSRSSQPRNRHDYQPPLFLIDSVELQFDLEPAATRVRAALQIRRNGTHQQALRLDGEQLQLLSLHLDGRPLTASDYQQDDAGLTIATAADAFCLVSEVLINPAANSALEGLYLSAGAFCSQCEAEGFRRISYFIDRPDVLSRYQVTIRAPRSLPQLLANGNRIDSGELADGRHFVVWQDPFPKPCYLFALVAGDFDAISDSFTTRSGRSVALEFYVDKGKAARAGFALDALKRAMAWDEQRFGLEYDLDIYMVVAVDFFNMGAMENKGLNVFNAKYVLADSRTATDDDYHGIEAVIGHEYFHNWTGNRITCRDWFQLSLKEGLTVFRDQLFSADMGSPGVNRIRNVRVIRGRQFAEDAGPMAHPIRPERVVEMNNFYSVTVYNKGAEVIRMLHSLLGESGFMRGMALYVQRHDGQAVTCDDFVAAMADANHCDLALFSRWYSQSGTPQVTARIQHDVATRVLQLQLEQYTPATPDQADKQPLLIPLRLELLSASGQRLALLDAGGQPQPELLTLTAANQQWQFHGIDQMPVIALGQDFSAPIKLDLAQPLMAQACLLRHASDPYCRWDSWQQLVIATLLADDEQPLPVLMLDALCALVTDDASEPALVAELLTLPHLETLLEAGFSGDLVVLQQRLARCYHQLAVALEAWSIAVLAQPLPRPYCYAGDAAGLRARMAAALYLRAALGDDTAVMAAHQAADNMSERLAALRAACHWQLPCADLLLARFASDFGDDPLTMDKWLALQAERGDDGAIERLEQITAGAHFDWANPNRVRALFGTFSWRNIRQFHRADGRGYRLLAEVVARLNSSNPQTAARLFTPFTQWRRFDAGRQQLVKAELERLMALPELSRDLQEVVGNSLRMAP